MNGQTSRNEDGVDEESGKVPNPVADLLMGNAQQEVAVDATSSTTDDQVVATS